MEKLYINDNRLKTLSPAVFAYTPELTLLDLAQNYLSFDLSDAFPTLSRLDWIDLSQNQLHSLSPLLLNNFSNITKLHLQDNKIETIDENAFQTNTHLFEIDLSKNRLTFFPPGLFKGLLQLRSLDLSDNSLVMDLPLSLFWELKYLKLLNLTGIGISNINRLHFSRNQNLTHLYFSRFKYCLFAPQVRICHPSSDGVSSLEHLLVYPILRVSVWIVAFCTCIGNLTVITWRSVSTNEDAVLSLFVKNLSLADLLMGVYLVSIGLNDIGFQDQYLLYALDWMSSWKCSAIGFLAMISSELSVLVLTIVAVERYRSIAFNSRLLTLTSARMLMAVTWLFVLSIAAYPLILQTSWTAMSTESSERTGEVGYYGSNGLCFPLHIDDPYASGWTYSAFVFLGLNFTAVLVMLILYTRMFIILNRDRSCARPGSIDKHREDVILAVRFFFIVFTDCLCWLPIVIIKIMAFTSMKINPTMYAWVVVFILPINSALNPILYTMAAPTEIRKNIQRYLSSLVSKMSCVLFLCPSCVMLMIQRNSNNSNNSVYGFHHHHPGVNIEGVTDDRDTDGSSIATDETVKRPSNASVTSVITTLTMKNGGPPCGNSRRGSAAKSLLNSNNQSTTTTMMMIAFPNSYHSSNTSSHCSPYSSVSPTSSTSPSRHHKQDNEDDDTLGQESKLRLDLSKIRERVYVPTTSATESDPLTASTIVDDNLSPLPPLKKSESESSNDSKRSKNRVGIQVFYKTPYSHKDHTQV